MCPATYHRRISQKNKIITFYEEERLTRRELHLRERNEKIEAYERVLKNLAYLVELEKERHR